jgi:hypothetical protein
MTEMDEVIRELYCRNANAAGRGRDQEVMPAGD